MSRTNRTVPLSVVMPVHNKRATLDESVASILGQSFGDFEFIILDDGSTDGSSERLREWAGRDARIRVLTNASRAGPVASSNRVMAEARAPLVARMDGDDIARSDRLLRQVQLLRERDDVVLAGSLFSMIDASGREVRPPDWGRLLRRSAFAPFDHPTIIVRRQAFEQVGGYRPGAERWEDVDLYLRLATAGRILVIATPLMQVRLSASSTRLADDRLEVERSMHAMYRALAGAPAPPHGDKLVPDAFLPVASLEVWQGTRPGVLRRLLANGALRTNLPTVRMLAWAAWADLGPRSLRAFLRLVLALRNLHARRRIGAAPVVEWRPSCVPLVTG